MAIYAIDFDNTLAITRFPEIVAPNKKMVAFAKAVKAQGHQIILWTSRAGADLENAVEWCRLQGLVFDAVNEPLPEQIKRWGNINFGKGDIWATFGWNNGLLPETYEDAKKDVVNFIRRINRKRKKLGLENAKYIYIIASEEYTRPHFHLLISGGIDRDELERMWGKCDRPNTRNISPDENFLLTGLATYITQNPHGTKRWCPSKNLKKPDEPKRSYSKFRKAKVEKMAFDSSVLQAEMEKAYPGFTFLDAEVKRNGVNAAFYIYARMVKKGEKPKGKPQKRKRGNKA